MGRRGEFLPGGAARFAAGRSGLRNGGAFFGGVGAGGAIGRIGDASAANAREGRELMRIAARGRHDVFDGMAANSERVGDKRAMAAPRDGFGAHDRAEFRV